MKNTQPALQMAFSAFLGCARLLGRLPGFSVFTRLLPAERVIDLDLPKRSWISRAIEAFVLEALSGSVRKLIRKGSVPRTVKIKFRACTVRLELNLLEYSQLNYYFGNVDVKLLSLIANGGKRYVDVGGFVGLYTCVAAHFFGAVDTFEPHPESRRALERNIMLNGLGNVRVHPVGLSDEEGVLELHEDRANQGGSSLEQCDPLDRANVYRVDIKTFDGVIADHVDAIDLMKIDVEGHEEHVIRGGLHAIAKHKPVLFVEVTSTAKALHFLQMLPAGYDAIEPVSGMSLSQLVPAPRFTDIVYAHKPGITVGAIS